MCVLAHLLFNIFFAAVINVIYTHFKEDTDITDALVHLRKNRGEGGGRGKQPPESQPWRGRFGASFTLITPESSLISPSS